MRALLILNASSGPSNEPAPAPPPPAWAAAFIIFLRISSNWDSRARSSANRFSVVRSRSGSEAYLRAAFRNRSCSTFNS